ncbi:hypothetical protein [Paenibacillus sp. YPG26]|uniref:hypothetical protein n=1 Tax=Paenibacillus sp. YPG26 TaxID=2878915 RepID=UPI00203CA3A5|nr:hypothetical protein [Paenibacillus sp. YPG26]USB33775.1 hypothetical protein LDO05_02820 [Paenibacillus sp. YPG26]
MLTYQIDPKRLDLAETQDGTDIEFYIKLHDEVHVDQFRLVQQVFDSNADYTDALFYAYANHEYKVIVRQEHYNDFVIELFKARLLRSLEWTD